MKANEYTIVQSGGGITADALPTTLNKETPASVAAKLLVTLRTKFPLHVRAVSLTLPSLGDFDNYLTGSGPRASSTILACYDTNRTKDQQVDVEASFVVAAKAALGNDNVAVFTAASNASSTSVFAQSGVTVATSASHSFGQGSFAAEFVQLVEAQKPTYSIRSIIDSIMTEVMMARAEASPRLTGQLIIYATTGNDSVIAVYSENAVDFDNFLNSSNNGSLSPVNLDSGLCQVNVFVEDVKPGSSAEEKLA